MHVTVTTREGQHVQPKNDPTNVVPDDWTVWCQEAGEEDVSVTGREDTMQAMVIPNLFFAARQSFVSVFLHGWMVMWIKSWS
jgi:hypothetical protein